MTNFTTLKRILARAGGRWAISWQAYLISVPISTIAIIGAAAKFASTDLQLLEVTGVAVACTLVIGILLYVLHKTIYVNSAVIPVSLAVIVLTGFIAGTIFTSGIALAVAMAGGGLQPNTWQQLILNSLLITWWGMTITLVLDDREKFIKQRDQVIADAIELQLVTLRGSETEERLRKALNKQISNEISEARSALNAAVKTAQTESSDAKWLPISDLMRNIASDVMRPLSKKLWNSAASMFPRPGLLKVIRTIIDSQPLRPLPMTIIVLLLSTENLITSFGLFAGLSVLVATVAFVWTAMPLANAGIRIWPKLHALFFWLTVVSFQIFDTVAWNWAGNYAGVVVTQGTLLLNIVASVILVLLTSSFGAYGNVNEQSLKDFRHEINARELSVLVKNRVVSALALEASKNLHGRVQTRLLSCAAAIDRATATGDIELLNKALIEVNEIFDSAALTHAPETGQSLLQKLSTIAAPWTGLCEITFELLAPQIDQSTEVTSNVADVVEEAITNAVRHGGASQVQVFVLGTVKTIELRVSDNGSGMVSGAQGVGIELIRMLSGGNFSFAPNSSGGVDLLASIAIKG